MDREEILKKCCTEECVEDWNTHKLDLCVDENGHELYFQEDISNHTLTVYGIPSVDDINFLSNLKFYKIKINLYSYLLDDNDKFKYFIDNINTCILEIIEGNVNKEIVKALSKNTSIKKLILWENKLEEDSLKYLAEGKTLYMLQMYNIELTDNDAKDIFLNCSFNILDINHCSFSPEMYKYLGQNKNLHTLCINNYNLKNEIKYIAENKNLHTLYIASSLSEDQIDYISNNKTLHTLKLDDFYNEYDEYTHPLTRLINNIVKNNTLHTLDISENKISVDDFKDHCYRFEKIMIPNLITMIDKSKDTIHQMSKNNYIKYINIIKENLLKYIIKDIVGIIMGYIKK